MSHENKDNSGVLFKNDRKETENQPDYKGSVKVDGVDYWLSAWIKEGQNGKFMSLATKRKDSQESRKPPPRRPAGRNYDDFPG